MATNTRALNKTLKKSMQKSEEAAKLARADLQEGKGTAYAALDKSLPLARDAINTGTNQQVGAYNDSINSYKQYGDQANQLLGGLFNDRVARYGQAGDRADAAYNTYNNSLGLGGEAGYQDVLGKFQNGPGYQFALDQGLEALQRNSAAAGNVNSGNTLMALQDYGRNMQNQEYGNWQDRLYNQQNSLFNQQNALDPTQLGGMYANGLNQLGSNIAGAQQGIGNAYGAQGNNLAELESRYGTSMANSALGFGTQLSNAGLQGAQIQQQGANTYAQSALQQQQLANQEKATDGNWGNLLLGIGSGLFGAAGSAGGFGSLFS